MDLDVWTQLSDEKRDHLRQIWRRESPKSSTEIRLLLTQALSRFRNEFKNHPLISRIDTSCNFSSAYEQRILVYTYLWNNNLIEDIPSEYATFRVQQYTETSRYQVCVRDGIYGVYDAHYTENGEIVSISHFPVSPVSTSQEELAEELRRYTRALDEPVLDFEKIPKHSHNSVQVSL